MNGFEINILYWIREHLTCPFLDGILPPISALSAHGEIWIVLALVLIAIPKTRRAGVTMAVTLILCLCIGNLTLKPLIARVRPYDVVDVPLLVEKLSDFSFPSGHTLASVGAATALTLYHRRWGAAALVLAAVIAFSRLYLFVHYPTDVVAGALLGVGLALLACRIVCWVWKPSAPKSKT